MKREILKNGAEVMDKCACTDGPGYVVLCRWKRSHGWEFITWVTDENMNCYHGNYYEDVEKARRNFWERVDRYCKPKETWRDGPCYYVSIIDGDRFNTVAGPYKTHKEALDMVEPARKKGKELDPKSHFYAWGTVKMETGHKEGMLNEHL